MSCLVACVTNAVTAAAMVALEDLRSIVAALNESEARSQIETLA